MRYANFKLWYQKLNLLLLNHFFSHLKILILLYNGIILIILNGVKNK